MAKVAGPSFTQNVNHKTQKIVKKAVILISIRAKLWKKKVNLRQKVKLVMWNQMPKVHQLEVIVRKKTVWIGMRWRRELYNRNRERCRWLGYRHSKQKESCQQNLLNQFIRPNKLI